MRGWWCQAIAGIATIFVAAAPMPGVAADEVEYQRDIKPLLQERCFACHGVLQQKGGLRVDTGEFLRRGGDGGEAVVPGQSEDSLLLQRVSAKSAGERMPPEGEPLTAAQIDLLRRWIAAGAKTPEGEKPEADPREHWAFRPPVQGPIPAGSAANVVDAFVNARLQGSGLAPRPAADKGTWLRRVTLDLIGLPPTREELRAFLADEAPAAKGAVVDRLLADPRHGERWGRHWMDVWRYADWHGRRHVPDVWNSAPQLWRWRDWIVNSLNDDHGYDRMVREMLAADEIAPGDDGAGVATGYLIRNWYALNPNDWMRANVEHVGKAFLGLTFNCAHCHDHKYDPITQDDYFRLRAYFETIGIRQDRVPHEPDPGPFQEYAYSVLRKVQRQGTVRIFDKNPDAPTWFYTGGDERNRVADRGSMKPGVPALLELPSAKVEPIVLPPRAFYPGASPALRETLLGERRAAALAAETALTQVRTATEPELARLRQTARQAEKEYAAAVETLRSQGRTGVLSGTQSLLFDATAGRRIVQNRLTSLAALEEGTTISFRMRLVRDAHFNFQLVKDLVQGLTASCVIFEGGHIRSYQPGGFHEFAAGRYDFAAGQTRFEVAFQVEPSVDRCLLTVRCTDDGKTLVENVPVALNGWNPVGMPIKGISFDARTGSVTAIDDVRITGPGAAAPPPRGVRLRTADVPRERGCRRRRGLGGFLVLARSRHVGRHRPHRRHHAERGRPQTRSGTLRPVSTRTGPQVGRSQTNRRTGRTDRSGGPDRGRPGQIRRISRHIQRPIRRRSRQTRLAAASGSPRRKCHRRHPGSGKDLGRRPGQTGIGRQPGQGSGRRHRPARRVA